MNDILVFIVLAWLSAIIISWVELIIKRIKKLRMEKYPETICRDCGLSASNGRAFAVSCWYEGKCSICGKIKIVTEARDFYLNGKTIKEIKELMK